MIVYKDVFEQLAASGWTTYRLVKERMIGNGTITRIKKGMSVSTDTIGLICKLAGCQPGDLISYEPDEKEEG